MKKTIILSFLVTCFAFNSFAKDYNDFLNDLKTCEKNYTNQKKEFPIDKFEFATQHTNKMIELGYKANDCYLNVGYNLIDTYYSQDSKHMKEALNNFAEVNFSTTAKIYTRLDMCAEGCGLIMQKFYVDAAANHLASIVFDMIRASGNTYLRLNKAN